MKFIKVYYDDQQVKAIMFLDENDQEIEGIVGNVLGQ